MAVLTRGSLISRADELITELGGDADALLRAHGIDPVAVGDFDRYVRYDDAAAVLGHAARELDCPDFGLRLGGMQSIASLGPLSVILRNAETVGEAITHFCRFVGNLAPADTARLTTSPGSAVYSYSTILLNDFDRRQMVEKNQALAMNAITVMIGQQVRPIKVTFQHERLAPLESYLDVFDCPAEFGQSQNTIHLPPAHLRRVIEDRDEAALALAQEYLARVHSGVALAEHVRDVTRRLLLVGEAGLSQVARAVSLHERTLQRALAAEGTTFEQILDQVRRATAWELAATGLQAAQIASALGYAEQSSFTRACRRWYGESPRALLRRRRGSRPEDPIHPEGAPG
ncbi:AraC family transcriptional regulator [Mycobacterium sp. ITM-2016-00317]|uniref:AraC family transcriptional regulator n=1 Tax=Mycobacterium sp. ITM-2016-00317 TaxID=2099694 RepID=UPI000D465987|nr:AraC family transcriptional regulator [Mycobacterium sp. ITM-2016-00317]WNG88033.1 AraC family transcriptional regulator [Mycobacterium sp. ITM-2016-00317]